MAYKLEQIEGIGPHFAAMLANAQVLNTDHLLRHARQPDGLQLLAERTRISLALLEAWANRADLMRVSGIGPEFSELLDASGIESVAELSIRRPENLVNLLHRVNAEKKLTRTVPTERTLTKWVMRAQDLEQLDKQQARAVASPPPMRQPTTGSGAGVGTNGRFVVSGTGAGPYRPM